MAERLTFEGNFCEIARCRETRWGKHCPDGVCSQRKVWERLKEYEDALSADIATVVHCKDCKHRDPEDKRCDCGCWHNPFSTNDNDFRSGGEGQDSGHEGRAFRLRARRKRPGVCVRERRLLQNHKAKA